MTVADGKQLLRLATAGSVDDGKSTLIGRLLLDAKLILQDTLDALHRNGTSGAPDLASITDGLRAEREQGITIDVAYRYFTTPRRSFIIADTPGPRALHAQHGHRRLDRAARGDPDRRAPRDHRAVAPPRLPLGAARDPPHGRGRQQDGPRRLGRGAASARSRASSPRWPSSSACATRAPSRSRRSTATTSSSAARRTGTTGRRCSSTSRRSTSRASAARARCGCRCSG